jgi:Mrp family chromosome partitioning ATPase
VARRLAQTAASRSISATVLDLADYKSSEAVPRLSAGNLESVGPIDVAATIDRLEAEYGMVIVRLPGLVTDAAAAALHERRPVLLVAPPTRIDREKLVGAVQLLRRIEVPCAGVVLNDIASDAVLTA